MSKESKFITLAKNCNEQIILSHKVIEDWKNKVISKEFLEECDSMSEFIKDMTD